MKRSILRKKLHHSNCCKDVVGGSPETEQSCIKEHGAAGHRCVSHRRVTGRILSICACNSLSSKTSEMAALNDSFTDVTWCSRYTHSSQFNATAPALTSETACSGPSSRGRPQCVRHYKAPQDTISTTTAKRLALL